MPGAVEVRLALAADASRLAAVHASSFPAAWSAADLARMLAEPGLALAAEQANEIVGFVLARAIAGEAEILTLAVHPRMRRGGVATRLLAALSAVLARRHVASLFLEVAADNSPARRLYGRAGFQEAGQRRGYYVVADGHGPVDAIVMAKRLDPGGEVDRDAGQGAC